MKLMRPDGTVVDRGFPESAVRVTQMTPLNGVDADCWNRAALLVSSHLSQKNSEVTQ